MPSPLRHQYLELKRHHPDAILLFRLGDFYETFDDDARIAARDLELVLTQRDMGHGETVPMAGVPHHALDSYLGRLIRKGHRVAICEQITEPTKGRTLVEREVVRVVTPGTVLEATLLDGNTNNYLTAVIVQGSDAGIAYADITTGEFRVAQISIDQLPQELARLTPTEVLIPEGPVDGAALLSDTTSTYHTTSVDPTLFSPGRARRELLDLFRVTHLEAFGCEHLPLAISAAGALAEYLKRTNTGALGQLQGLVTYSTDTFMTMDSQTRRNLELFEGGRWHTKDHSLLTVLDLTKTPMGTRLLRRWISQPSLDLIELTRRQDSIEWLYTHGIHRARLQTELDIVTDPERVLHRVGAGIIMPREMVTLRRSLERIPVLKELLSEEKGSLEWLNQELPRCDEAVETIAEAIVDDPQGEVGQGGVIRFGFSSELDETRSASQDARSYIADMERRERDHTGINSLKVGYNRVFGYYLEISHANRVPVPDHYVRRQTLASAERYFTPELKEYEDRVLNSRQKIEELERALFHEVCVSVSEKAKKIARASKAIALLDAFTALAEAAVRYGYNRPILDEGNLIDIRGGRHPVIERHLPSGSFVPNDTVLDRDNCQVMILTGPNMAGKSTYLRQVALLVLMAQMGSFIPAEAARIGLVDRIFTRVGLQDDLTTGQSTFMVEMVETATILHQATSKALVILDEIGRGTSTYDGMSIAQAVLEHLHESSSLGCRTLFATHYHELTEMARHLPRVRNYNVTVVEEDGDLVFLHRIVPGSADRSYGVHVAKLAGLPRSVVRRAWNILARLESTVSGTVPGELLSLEDSGMSNVASKEQEIAFHVSRIGFRALGTLHGLDLDSMSPLEALNKLHELQELVKEEGFEG